MKATMRTLLRQAKEGHFAIPAMNYLDFASAKAFLDASQEKNLPLILAFAESHSKWLPLEEAARIGTYLQECSKTPVVLHLDHGQTIAFIKKAILLGFNSVMIDASLDSFEENVRKTKEIMAFAHKYGVDVEAEIGFVGANANLENHSVAGSVYTSLDNACTFYQETQVDSLAISIGTAHGLYQGTPHIDFARLAEISKALPIPLVLHGGSSSGDGNLNRCAKNGISKINIFSDVISAAYKVKDNHDSKDYPTLVLGMQKAMKEVLLHYYDIFETQEVKNGKRGHQS
ncbi:class II fructose-bisphosphate aldolase [Streptococcus iniae]|uniref:class II fructose-bisphosphate aldolase n=1 Tax=Streptococcus iniae TaxID=1346 RepID=UPI0008DB0688|nr:class II fructose-bisphosphate aldolase [Streptococcus iniae]OHX27066.1 fructose-bisphosphate aldolase [Streptococcus iniae]RLV28550.1 class II fructose-bisphosphate aldolase [Streptococcus iniae]